jgi:hypothetical protein
MGEKSLKGANRSFRVRIGDQSKWKMTKYKEGKIRQERRNGGTWKEEGQKGRKNEGHKKRKND